MARAFYEAEKSNRDRYTHWYELQFDERGMQYIELAAHAGVDVLTQKGVNGRHFKRVDLDIGFMVRTIWVPTEWPIESDVENRTHAQRFL